MDKNLLNKIKKFFKEYPKVKLVYLFGSRAKGKEGPLSDYDFALYLDEKDKKKRFDLKLKFTIELPKILKVENVDIIILNDSKFPELKYNIISEGRLIYEKEPFKVMIEPRILSDYFDFNFTLKKYGLTKERIRQIKEKAIRRIRFNADGLFDILNE